MAVDARKTYESELGRQISDFLWNVLMEMDKFYVPGSQLKEECRKRGLPVSGDKKTLIYRLLESEFIANKAS